MLQIPGHLRLGTMTDGLMSYTEAMKLKYHRVAAHTCIWAPQEGASKFGELRAAVMVSE